MIFIDSMYATGRQSRAGSGAKGPGQEGGGLIRPLRPAMEVMTMARNSERPSSDARPRRPAWRERAFVLGGLALAVPVTAVAPFIDLNGEIVGFLWLIAVAWTAVASLAAALRRGLVHGDRSAFGSRGRRHECRRHACPPDTGAEGFDWNTRTGAFAYVRIAEDRERLLEDDGLRNHDRGI